MRISNTPLTKLKLGSKHLDSINLCMLAPEFFPVWGGTGSYIVELIKFLPRNVNIHVITLKRDIPGMSNSFKNNDINSIIGRPLEIHYLSASKETFFYNLPFQIACLRKIPSLHKEHKFDIIHSHLCHMPDVFLQLFVKIRVPTVLTIHGTIQMLREHALIARSLFSDLESSENSILRFYPIIKLLQQNYVKHITRFIAVSNITKELAIRQLNIGKERISLVYNGVDTNLFSPPKENKERKYLTPTVVYIGRLIAKKGINVLIQAVPKVLQIFPKTRFLFVGGGNVPLYKEMLTKMGIPEKNFSFIGHVGYFERNKILQEATVFVNPSFFENCSLSILEAMSCGCAVVACNVGGNPEIIKSGKNGLLVSAFDDKSLAKSIIFLLENGHFNKEIGEQARRTVEHSFSSATFAEKTYRIYKQTLSNAC
jgi:glycosyltransferase involved in cell wall biosynthesis